MPRLVVLPIVFLGALCATQLSFAQAPSISRLSPQAVGPGQTVDVTVTGGNLAGATELWTSFGERAPLSPDVADNGSNAGSVVFRVTAPAEGSLGIHGVRVTTPGGVSSLKAFVVDDLPSIAEAGGNNSPETAQVVALPCAIDGQVDNLSRDYFKFDVAAGQRVSFEVLARRLGSPLDSSLYLYRADGRELFYNDDVEGLSSDSQFAYTFEEAGTYVLEIRDIQYAGGGNHTYRLRIGDFPCVNVAVPMAVQRGTSPQVVFAGSSVEDVAPVTLAVPADSTAEWLNVSAKRPGGTSSAFASVAVSAGEEFVEQEPNEGDQANGVTLGASLNGRFEQAGDIDRFAFDAKQGQRFEFTGVTRLAGAPTDLMLRLYDPAGNQVAAVDDTGTAEGVINYTFPADGRYTLAVHDLNHRGGPEFAYRVHVAPYQPGFTLSATADVLNVPAGGIATITVNAVRRDYNGEINLEVAGLPDGLTTLPTRIGPGMTLAVLTVQAAADAAVNTLLPVTVVGTAKVGETDVRDVAAVTDALRAQWSNTVVVPGELRDSVALATTPSQALSLRIEPAEIVFGKELRATVKVIAERGEGRDAAIALAVNPAQNGLPPNVAAEVKPIDAGQNEVEIAFTANENAPLGPFTVVLSGTHSKDNVNTVVSTPGIGLRLEAPFTITPSVSDPKLVRGGELKLKVAVARNPAFAGEVKITLDKLPAGVTAAEAVIPADQSEVEVTLTAAADAAAGEAAGIVVNAVAPANAKFTATATAPAITVE